MVVFNFKGPRSAALIVFTAELTTAFNPHGRLNELSTMALWRDIMSRNYDKSSEEN